MRRSSLFALALMIALFAAGAAAASPAAPGFAAWLADTAPAPAPAIGTPLPEPRIALCTQPPQTFCENAQCQCQQRGGICLCGGFMNGCNQAAHTFTCICRQC